MDENKIEKVESKVDKMQDLIGSNKFRIGILVGMAFTYGAISLSRKHRDRELRRVLNNTKLQIDIYQVRDGVKEALDEIKRF